MPYRLVRSTYIGFRNDVARRLSHVEGDFLISEIVGEVSDDTGIKLRKAFGRSYLTLDDLPGVINLNLPGRDRETLMRAFRGLKPNEKIELRR